MQQKWRVHAIDLVPDGSYRRTGCSLIATPLLWSHLIPWSQCFTILFHNTYNGHDNYYNNNYFLFLILLIYSSMLIKKIFKFIIYYLYYFLWFYIFSNFHIFDNFSQNKIWKQDTLFIYVGVLSNVHIDVLSNVDVLSAAPAPACSEACIGLAWTQTSAG